MPDSLQSLSVQVPSPQQQPSSRRTIKTNGATSPHKATRIAFAEDVVGGCDEETDAQSNPQDAGLTVNGAKVVPPAPPTAVSHSRRSSSSHSWKRRKRGRVVHVATIDTSTPNHLPALPSNQYSTVLIRRAIYKLEDIPEGQTPTLDHGDISLGMKLIIAGGRVIVQTLNCLKDGRASPAQLTGVIQRGDVLLAVGDMSLANLPIDQLMTGLKPLSTPLEGGKYQREVRVRLEAGVGMELLQNHERGIPTPALTEGQAAVVNDMFTLFPMVDQLSGAPLVFEQLKEETNVVTGTSPNPKQDVSPPSPDVLEVESPTHDNLTPDDLISAIVAQQRILDRERFTSEFFDWSEKFSDLLRATQASKDKDQGIVGAAGWTKAERIEFGLQVMNLAKKLTYNMEDLDKGKDLRSFKMWSTNFSLRSGASARRRHIMDTASLRSHRRQDANESMDESIGSERSGSLGSVDGDALLLGLAAHDDIWRKQIIEALKESIDKKNKGEAAADDDDNTDTDTDELEKQIQEKSGDIDAILSNELGAFLFGENMNSIIKKKKKSYALPPEDITTVLFDLTTHITTSAPDEVTTFGGTTNSFSLQSSFGTQGKARAQHRADILLANRFLLEEVLPLWLESFRPLGLEQRRLFWPKLRRAGVGSHGGTNTQNSDNDSLTVDSHGSGSKHDVRGTKTLEEMIEDLELDVETRSETCFLVTYYFTQQILSKYVSCSKDLELEAIDDEVDSFVRRFGTYLQIHSCLVFSASVEAEKAVDALLEVAQYDPSHVDTLKEFQKVNDLTFYEASKLSALIQLLRGVRQETPERRRMIKNICVSAYPDVQPWQMKKACVGPLLVDQRGSHDTLPDLYYSYLSQLLDPVEGQELARRSSTLVKEWCECSIGVNNGDNHAPKPDRLANFYLVASRTSSAHLAYRRDLLTLLEMSMSIKEYNLALELTTEIIEDRKLCGRSNTLHRVLGYLREIGMEGLSLAWESRQAGSDFHMLKRVLRAFHQMSSSNLRVCSESIDVPEELVAMLEEWERKSTCNDPLSDVFILVDFMINESAPIDVLSALVLWSSSHKLGSDVFSRLDSLLRRGVQFALKGELSGSLLRLKYMRRGYTEDNKTLTLSDDNTFDNHSDGEIWKRMSLGALTIDK